MSDCTIKHWKEKNGKRTTINMTALLLDARKTIDSISDEDAANFMRQWAKAIKERP